jgi:hypothetical protein
MTVLEINLFMTAVLNCFGYHCVYSQIFTNRKCMLRCNRTVAVNVSTFRHFAGSKDKSSIISQTDEKFVPINI